MDSSAQLIADSPDSAGPARCEHRQRGLNWLALVHGISLASAGLVQLGKPDSTYGLLLWIMAGGTGMFLLLAVARQCRRLRETCRERDEAVRRLDGEAAKLRALAERHRLLTQHSRDALLTLDLPGWKFSSGNPASLALFGLASEAELKELLPQDLSPPAQPDGADSAENARRMVALALENGSHFFEWTHRRRNGESFPATVLLSRINHGGGLFIQATVRDISVQKRSEERLRELNENLERLVTHRTEDLRRSQAGLVLAQRVGKMGSWELDHVSGQLTWSEEVFRLFELPPDRFAASYEAFLAAVHPDDRALVDQAYRDSIRQRTPYEVSHRLLMPDGRIKYVIERGETRYTETGMPACSSGTVLDITEQRQAELALQDSLRLLRTVVENAPVRIFWKDAVCRYLGCNRLFAQDAGCNSPEEVVGKTDFDLGWRAEAELYRADDRKIIEQGSSRLGYVEPQTTPDGRTIWLRTSKVPLLGDAGRIIGVLGIYDDITDQVQAERSLRESEAKFRTLSEKALVGVCLVQHGRFLYANGTLAEMLGQPAPELLGLPSALAPVLRAQRPRLRRLARTWLAGQSPEKNLELSVRRPDGSLRMLEAQFTVIAFEDRPALLGTVLDLTERRNLELQVLRKQRLESLGTLAGGVAHDLNNSLSPVLMVMQALRASYPREQELLVLVEASARRAAAMVKQLLTFARGAEGERVPLHPLHLIRDMARIITGTFPKDIRLQLDLPAELPPVLGDATQLHQVLLNLCVNARDAMPHGGDLTIAAHVVSADPTGVDPTAGQLAIVVKDTGTGIPAHLLDQVFDPFFTTKQADRGTGLGLSTALGIVRGHGGTIQVSSQPGAGSTFSVFLPLMPDSDKATPEEAKPVFLNGHGRKLLLVDDEELVRTAGAALLRRLNFEPVLAAGGSEALELLKDSPQEYFAVITDYHMPGMNGLELSRSIREQTPGLPILISSGRLDAEALQAFDPEAKAGRIDKPYGEADLARALGKLRPA